MNWPTSTYLNIRQKLSARFLIVFSFCTLALAGVLWACADSDEWEYSAFTPELFVSKQYSPFFYTGNQVYYGLGYSESNVWYNNKITDEWYNHFNKQFSRKSLSFLLTKASQGMIDTVYKNYAGTLHALPAAYPDSVKGKPDKARVTAFFKYLQLAKSCEEFTVYKSDYSWEKVVPVHAPANIEKLLNEAFQKETDVFIKSRLWFQLVRYYYFRGDGASNAKSVAVFNKYKDSFAKDLTYYRALGYVAGYYYHEKNYALSNYLYSLCYNYSYEMKVPSYWSFHPQNETDWQATLRMAKSKDEQITLWQMLGIEYDEGRAISKIVAIDPKAEKLDLLLSRMINGMESVGVVRKVNGLDSASKSHLNNRRIVEAIALKNNTAKPYFWNLAAGYINYMDSNYNAAGKFYAIAKKQFPAGDVAVEAQGRLLDILLMVKKLRKIDATTEQQLTEPLNWLAEPASGKSNLLAQNKIRYEDARATCTQAIARLYHKQGNLVREVCFNNNHLIYKDSAQVENLVKLLTRPNKTPFETVMTRYYKVTLNNLYYHQALNLVYKEQTGKAIVLLKKMKPDDFVLYANPFNNRINDCHDCDAAAPQKQKFSPLTFVQTLQNLQAEIKAGKNIYRNALLLANAYYNISYYGNGRAFYEGEDLGTDGSDMTTADRLGINDPQNKYGNEFYDMTIATRYYALALHNAATAEQQARCTFMLSKCDQNDFYNGFDTSIFRDLPADSIARYHNKFFPVLKKHYSQTAYYKEVLKECGYFRSYASGK